MKRNLTGPPRTNSPYRILRALTAGLIVFGLAACKSKPREALSASVPPKVDLKSTEQMFEPDIARFEQMERDSPSAKGGIVFTGSSSIRLWETLEADMAPLPVINRGFGGSIIRQVSHYTERIVLPLQPKLIVLYCGENDIANDVYPHTDPLQNYQDFVAIIRHHLPDTPILYLAMKPSPLRWPYWEKFARGNRLIEEYTQREADLEYIDVSEVMLGVDGRPQPEIFVSDSLHMNADGYAQWTALIRPAVERLWEKVNAPGQKADQRPRGTQRKD
ncbi:MAG: SGNH/GDSL hydrolase family protein [Bacteroidota bacterium]